MSYYPEPDIHIREFEKKLNDDKGVDTSNLAVKSNFIALKAEVDKVDINKLVNVLNSLNNLKTKVDDLNVGKLKTVPIDLKKLNDAVSKDVVKNTEFNKLKTKVINLEKKILIRLL